MTITPISQNAAVVSHEGKHRTFVDYSFAQLVMWAMEVQWPAR